MAIVYSPSAHASGGSGFFFSDDAAAPSDAFPVSDADHNTAINLPAGSAYSFTAPAAGSQDGALSTTSPSAAFLLNQARAAQSLLIDSGYAETVTADISFTTAAGVTATFQADADSQQVLSVSLQGYERAGAVPDGFFWKATDNTKVPFTLADLGALDKAMLDRGWVAFQKRTTLKAEIAAATTVAEVQAITW